MNVLENIEWLSTELEIVKVTNTDKIYEWVEDENYEEGGSFQPIIKYYDSPKALICFKGVAKSDIFIPHAVYASTEATFVALSKNKVVTMSAAEPVNSFHVPRSLALVYQTYVEGTVPCRFPPLKTQKAWSSHAGK